MCKLSIGIYNRIKVEKNATEWIGILIDQSE